MAIIKPYQGRAPKLEGSAFVAETAAIVGDVTLKRGTSVFYSAVLRADSGSITIGENTKDVYKRQRQKTPAALCWDLRRLYCFHRLPKPARPACWPPAPAQGTLPTAFLQS